MTLTLDILFLCRKFELKTYTFFEIVVVYKREIIYKVESLSEMF